MTHFRYLDAQIKKAIRRNGFESGSCFDRKVLSARPDRPTVCWPHNTQNSSFSWRTNERERSDKRSQPRLRRRCEERCKLKQNANDLRKQNQLVKVLRIFLFCAIATHRPLKRRKTSEAIVRRSLPTNAFVFQVSWHIVVVG